MNSVNHLKRDYEEIFRNLLEFEKIIDSEDIDNINLSYVFHKLMGLLLAHRKNEKSFFVEIKNKTDEDNSINIKTERALINTKSIRGHIMVINQAIMSKDDGRIKLALDNDGRMLVSKIKDYIFKDEEALDRLLFLHIVTR